MRILRVNHRHFLVQSDRDYENVALKLLNEHRIFGRDTLKLELLAFIEKITDEQDGEMAVQMLPRLFEAEVIAPEVI